MIGAFHVNRRLRTRTNLLLMSLAVADMLVGTISLPLWVYLSVTFTDKGLICKVYLIVNVICGVSSILNITAVSLERYYALRRPIKHRNIRKSMLQFFSILKPFSLINRYVPSFSVVKMIIKEIHSIIGDRVMVIFLTLQVIKKML